MHSIIQIVGRDRTLEVYGIKLVGISAENGKKLLFTLLFIVAVVLISRGLKLLARLALGEKKERAHFWTRQAIRLVIAVLMVVGLISIWFTDPSRLASAAAFVTAGLAIASQRAITSISGYFIILSSKTFNVGDRIVMGGVRGDVIALTFMQTTIMEMGQPPGEQSDAPSMWVSSRQYTGRMVTITNDKVFDTPVYNYSREFPFIWEEMHIAVPFDADLPEAERIIVEAATRHTMKIAELSQESLAELERRYAIRGEELKPRVFYRITDNWVEMAVRFIVRDHAIRHTKDAISREILTAFSAAKIEIASGTYDVVGMPELKVRVIQ